MRWPKVAFKAFLVSSGMAMTHAACGAGSRSATTLRPPPRSPLPSTAKPQGQLQKENPRETNAKNPLRTRWTLLKRVRNFVQDPLDGIVASLGVPAIHHTPYGRKY